VDFYRVDFYRPDFYRVDFYRPDFYRVDFYRPDFYRLNSIHTLNEREECKIKTTASASPPHAPRGQEVGPDVDRLVVQLEAAEDAVQRRAARVAVSRDDAILPEHLWAEKTPGYCS